MSFLNLPSLRPAARARRRAPAAFCCLAALAACAAAAAEGTQGRVFLPTPETVAIYEFNELPAGPGTPLFPGTVILDLSGNCLNAVVEGELVGAGNGDACFNVPPREVNNLTFRNTTVRKTADFPFTSFVAVDEAVDKEGGAFEMDETQDFTIELFVRRDASAGAANSGILAGTWHSRNLIDDSGKEDVEGAWYGFGLMRLVGAPRPDGGTFPTGGWKWVLSPVIDGQPSIGLSAQSERFLDPAFEIPAGPHYVVLTIDRSAQLASGYVDGDLETLRDLEPDWAFITPPGRDPARFLMLSGEDDRSRGAYRGAPTGYHIDAVRVQRKAMTAEEVQEAQLAIRACRPWPAPALTAVITAAAFEGVTGQCFRLSASNSIAGPERTITKHEWKVGGGAFELGGPSRNVSFDAAGPPEGIPVTLRITDDALQSATRECRLRVASPEPIAAIDLKIDDLPILGDSIPARLGAALAIDGSRSATPVTPGISDCEGNPVLPAAITAFAWDLDGDGATDSTAALPPPIVLSKVGVVEISLEVANSTGRKGRTTRTIEVVDGGGNSIVFHPTADTILGLEFNDHAPDIVLPEGSQFPDLSGGGLALTIREPRGEIASAPGAPQFAGSRSVAYLGGGVSGPRGVIENDQNAFEFGPRDSFTFEIYARPGEAETPFWGDVAGTFRARTRDPDPESQPRYGWGIIKSHLKEGYMWFTAHGTPEESIVPFTMARGIYSYVACVADRSAQRSRVFVNGDLWSEITLDPSWDFRTPAGFQHASFLLFTREQKDGEFYNIIPGMAVEALRVQRRALTGAEVAANWENIRRGLGADSSPAPDPAAPTDLVAAPLDGQVVLDWDEPPPEAPPIDGYNLYRSTARGGPYTRVNTAIITGRRYTDAGLQNGTEFCYVVRAARGARESASSNEACATPTAAEPRFRRGDTDANGAVEITDAVALLGFLFLGETRPPCFDAADADDNSALEITDAVFSLGYQFLGETPPPDPGPLACGPDPTPDLPGADYGCGYPGSLCQ